MMKITMILNRLMESVQLVVAYYSDYRSFVKSHGRRYMKSRLECQTLLTAHALEKGMSFVSKRNNWGEVKASLLCKLLNEHFAKDEEPNEAFILSLNVLGKYRNDECASKDIDLLKRMDTVLNSYVHFIREDMTGVKTIEKPSAFDEEEICRFFKSRSSVRDFSHEPVTEEQIRKALEFAALTPTACNRQSSRVYAFRNKDTQRKILDLQLGDQGWCGNADTIFIITGVETYFGWYERSEVFIDGGLFAMNFVYGLHLQQIATCYKMFVRSPKIMKKFKSLCNIPDNETPIVLILAGHYLEKPSISPKSHRMKVAAELDGRKLQ